MFPHGLTSPTAIQFFEAFKRKLGECITNQLRDKAPVPHLTTPVEVNMAFTALTLEQKKKAINDLVTWFQSVVTYNNGEDSQQHYNKSPYSNVVETCMHYRGLGVCRHHVATFKFCLQTIAQLDTCTVHVSKITSSNDDTLTYQLFTNGRPTHDVLGLNLDGQTYIIDPTGSSHQQGASNGAVDGHQTSRTAGNKFPVKDFYENLNPDCQQKLKDYFKGQPKVLEAIYVTVGRDNKPITGDCRKLCARYILSKYRDDKQPLIKKIQWVPKTVPGGSSIDITSLTKSGKLSQSKKSLQKKDTYEKLVLSSTLAQMLISFSVFDEDKAILKSIPTNDTVNHDTELLGNIDKSYWTIFNASRLLLPYHTVDIFPCDASQISRQYFEKIYKKSPYQAILLLKPDDAAHALLTSIDPDWQMYLKSPDEMSREELLKAFESYPYFMALCNPIIRTDSTFVLDAIKMNPFIIRFVCAELKKDINFLIRAIKANSKVISEMEITTESENPSFIKQCLEMSQYIGDSYKSFAFARKRLALLVGSASYQHVLTWLEQAPPRKKEDLDCRYFSYMPNIPEQIIGFDFKFMDELNDDQYLPFFLKFFNAFPELAQHMPTYLQNNIEFIQNLVLEQPLVYFYLSDQVISSLPDHFYTEAIKQCVFPDGLLYRGPDHLFRNNKSFIEGALMNISSQLGEERAKKFLVGNSRSIKDNIMSELLREYPQFNWRS